MPELTSLEELSAARKRLVADRRQFAKQIIVSGGTCGEACGAGRVVATLRQALKEQGSSDTVSLRATGCHGFCGQGPLMVIEPGNILYCHLSPDDADEIVGRTVAQGEVIERLLYTDPVSGERVRTEAEVPFYRAQDRVLLDRNKEVDPASIADYIATGGYAALAQTLGGMEPEAVIAEVKAAGLRGRGGGGYPTGRKWEQCRAAAREYGLLGEDILGTDFAFDVTIARGAGAFVCGESTALMASLEGKVGEPRPKDVHTVEDGLRHQPTVLNNVETWANVPLAIARGAPWFAARGTEGSTGTKIFALTGRVKNTGLVEVDMGTSLRQIVFDIGGGAANGTGVKAVQTGGPSGGCLPLDQFDLPVDFDSLAQAGSMVGSGGIVVMDEKTCMVDVAKYFLAFLQDESCGKCTPCRLGVDRMLEIVTDITEGRGRIEQLDLLEELAETVGATSLCALGKTAPNPVLSTLRYFRDEYEAHIRDGQCPAGVCRALITYSIDPDACTGCTACRKACPHEAIAGEAKQPHAINPDLCTRCGICQDACPSDAVRVA